MLALDIYHEINTLGKEGKVWKVDEVNDNEAGPDTPNRPFNKTIVQTPLAMDNIVSKEVIKPEEKSIEFVETLEEFWAIYNQMADHKLHLNWLEKIRSINNTYYWRKHSTNNLQ